MNNTPGETSNPTEVHLYSPFLAGSAGLQRAGQSEIAARLIVCTAALDHAEQAQMLKSRLTAAQSAALAQFTQLSTRAVSETDLAANELAMRALLEPHNPLHPLRARCLHAKARAIEFGMRQFGASVSTCTGSFEDLVAEMRALLDACRSAHARNAGALTHALVGGDPTDAVYIATRTEAAVAQGGDEAYCELREWFDDSLARGTQGTIYTEHAHG